MEKVYLLTGRTVVHEIVMDKIHHMTLFLIIHNYALIKSSPITHYFRRRIAMLNAPCSNGDNFDL